jgi:hypothetical protein
MNKDKIQIIEDQGIHYVAAQSEQIQISDELAGQLAGKNQEANLWHRPPCNRNFSREAADY